MTTAVVDSPSLTFAEVGGVTLKLTNRALPYLPLSISGKQRAEFTWYPGSPQATVQMLGPEEGVISLRGYWKDRFIAGTGDASYANSDVLSALTAMRASRTTVVIASVADLVKQVDAMRRMGRVIDFAWGDIRRRGHITSFTQTWHTVHDCEWELEFAVSAIEASNVPVATAPAVNVAGVAASAKKDAFAARDARFGVEKVAELGPLESFSKLLSDFDTAATLTANKLVGIAQLTTAFITAPGDAARRILATTSGFVTQLSRSVGTTCDAALTEYYAVASLVGGQDSAPFGLQLGGASYNRIVRNTMREVLYSNAYYRYVMAQQLNNEIQVSYVTPDAADLRDVSTRFYGTPDNWKVLMAYNGFTDSKLTAGQLVWVPVRAEAGAPGLTQGGAL